MNDSHVNVPESYESYHPLTLCDEEKIKLYKTPTNIQAQSQTSNSSSNKRLEESCLHILTVHQAFRGKEDETISNVSDNDSSDSLSYC